MNIILFDTESRATLFPLTLTKAVVDIRLGILTIKERWEKLTGATVFILTDTYLLPLYDAIPTGDFVFVDARIIPSFNLVESLNELQNNQGFGDENGLIAGRVNIKTIPLLSEIPKLFQHISTVPSAKRLMWPHQIFQWNAEMLQFDFELITKGRTSKHLNNTVHVSDASKLFIEDGAKISYSILNTSAGPIYIGKDAEIMENCTIRGPFSIGERSVLKMGAKIYGATTMGPFCIGGGEIKNSVLTGYSNKAHDGYLGDSVIGEWCNLGAGTSNSNLKNTAGEIKTWNYYKKDYMPSGNKCGVIMGDYSKTAINTSINSGTVIGTCCNVFTNGLTPKFIPDFTWGEKEHLGYEFEKAVKDIDNWKKLKNKTISVYETQILKHIFDRYSDSLN